MPRLYLFLPSRAPLFSNAESNSNSNAVPCLARCCEQRRPPSTAGIQCRQSPPRGFEPSGKPPHHTQGLLRYTYSFFFASVFAHARFSIFFSRYRLQYILAPPCFLADRHTIMPAILLSTPSTTAVALPRFLPRVTSTLPEHSTPKCVKKPRP